MATCHHLSGATWPASCHRRRHRSHHRTTSQQWRSTVVVNDGQRWWTTIDHHRTTTGTVVWPGRVNGRHVATDVAEGIYPHAWFKQLILESANLELIYLNVVRTVMSEVLSVIDLSGELAVKTEMDMFCDAPFCNINNDIIKHRDDGNRFYLVVCLFRIGGFSFRIYAREILSPLEIYMLQVITSSSLQTGRRNDYEKEKLNERISKLSVIIQDDSSQTVDAIAGILRQPEDARNVESSNVHIEGE
ncbi:hypothetical protein Tco_1161209 [Tanacetum coccineum]